MTVLTVDGLSKTFDMHVLGDTQVVGLDDVSFDVREGEFLAGVRYALSILRSLGRAVKDR